MSETLHIQAQPRSDAGKGASRRLRRAGQVPGILYGGDKAPTMFMMPHDDLVKHTEKESFYASLLDLNLGGEQQQVVLKDLQRHPAKPFFLHIDFQRVSQGEKLRMTVPIHFENEAQCKGVKLGGQASHNLTELDIHCLPQDLPEFIPVNMLNLEVGQIVHVADLVLPQGVEVDNSIDPDTPVVVIHAAHSGDAEEESAEAED